MAKSLEFTEPETIAILPDDILHMCHAAADSERYGEAMLFAFENTIDALELSGRTLGKVSAIFFNLNESNNSPEMTEVENAVTPMLTELNG